MNPIVLDACWPDGTPRSTGNAFTARTINTPAAGKPLTSWSGADLDSAKGRGYKTAYLLNLLRRSPRCTKSLCDEAGVTSKVVWGLLKWHQQQGAISHDLETGIWMHVREHQPTAISRAAKLLEANGWSLYPPVHQ